MCVLTPLWVERERNKRDFEWVVDMSSVISGCHLQGIRFNVLSFNTALQCLPG